MKKIKKLKLFVIVCLLLTAVAALTIIHSDKTVLIASAAQFSLTDKIYSDATLADDFCDDSIIVVMDEKFSNFRGVSSRQSALFDGIGVESIEDLSALPESFVSADGTINARTAPALAEHFAKVPFRQILHITLAQQSKQHVLDTIRIIEKFSGVRYCGPNAIECGQASGPNDPRYVNNEQWGLNGQYGINAPEAWAITAGSRNVRVGVIDSGIEQYHEDLNPAGNSNIVAGWDFVNDSATLRTDVGGHGSKVSGVLGAVGDNGTGITGVAQKVSIVPLQTAHNTSGRGSHQPTDVIKAIKYATALWGTSEQISVLNYSVEGFGIRIEILEEVKKFPGLFVWISGNDNIDVERRANINQFKNVPNLISVGAMNSSNERWVSNSSTGSNWGEESVDIFAPGEGILTTIPNHEYGTVLGTSFAAPVV